MTSSASTDKSRNDELALHQGLVRRLVITMLRKLPASVEADDLYQAGMIALNKAIDSFDGTKSSFETYATWRIRGAILDELRAGDWMSRLDRRHHREVEAELSRLQSELGRRPTESEMAQRMDMSLEDFQARVTKVYGTGVVYLEDMGGEEDSDDFLARHMTDDSYDPLKIIEREGVYTALDQAIEKLPDRLRDVTKWRLQGLLMKDVGAILGVTESRVCQLNVEAERVLARLMRDWKE